MQIYQPLMIEDGPRPPPDPIRLIDALGRHHLIPRDWCARGYTEELIDIICGPPELNVLAEHVHKRHYILKNANGEMILPIFWKFALQSGMTYEMEMWSMPELETIDVDEALRMKPRQPQAQLDQIQSSTGAHIDSQSLEESKTVKDTTISNSQAPMTAVEILVELLFCNTTAALLNSAALKDPQIGEYRTYKKLFSLLLQFARATSQMDMARDHWRVVKLLQSVRTSSHLALFIIQQTETCNYFVKGLRWPHHKWHLMIESEWNDANDILDWEVELLVDPVTDRVDDLSALKQEDMQQIANELLNSSAYFDYMSQLLDFVHQPYRKRLEEALDNVLLPASEMTEGQYSKEVLAFKLSWIPPKLFTGSWEGRDTCWSVSNRAKRFLERCFGNELHWAPWHPPFPMIPSEYFGRIWKTPAGKSEVMFHTHPRNRESAFSDAALSKPEFLDLATNLAVYWYDIMEAPMRRSTDISPRPVRSGGSKKSLGIAVPLPTEPGRSHQHSSIPSTSPQYVTLCIRQGENYRLIPIQVDNMKSDLEFFSALRSSYIATNGLFQDWFSIWRYSHCDFVRFEKNNDNVYAPAEIEYPTQADKDEYSCRRLDPSLRLPGFPITEQEFHDHFYKPNQPFHSWYRYNIQRFLGMRYTALQSLPTTMTPMSNDRNEKAFWGLYVRERLSVAWISAYAMACCTPATISLLLWLVGCLKPKGAAALSTFTLVSATMCAFKLRESIQRSKNGTRDARCS